jgi:hypothetical protein
MRQETLLGHLANSAPLRRIVVVGALPVGAAAALTMATNVPSAVSPFSISVVLPAMFLLELVTWRAWFPPWGAFLLIATLWASLYGAWTLTALPRAPAVPLRSKILFGITAALSVLHLAAGASYGVQYQGLIHTAWVSVVGVTSIAGLAALLLVARRSPSTWRFSAFHIGLFCWLGWVAFPWLGELI